MAQTYVAGTAVGGISFATNKSLISLYNLNGSGRVVRIYKIEAKNLSIANVSATVPVPFFIERISAESGGTAITPISFRSSNESIASIVSARTNGTTTAVASSIMGTYLISGTDEPAPSSLGADEFWCFPIMCNVWDTGYGETEVEPITLNANQGIQLRQSASLNSQGTFGFYIYFTVANS